MKYLFLWFQGMLQSWGADSRFDLRQTQDFPTKSGIYGLLLAASGDNGPQEELLGRMADCPLAIVTFRSTIGKLQDFHMVGNGYDDKDKWQSYHIPRKADGTKAVGGGAKRTYREYLQEKVFAAILGLPDDLAEKFDDALRHPVFDLYLGRKCCAPTSMILQGCFSTEENAFAALQEKIASENDSRLKDARTASPEKLLPEWIVREDEHGDAPTARLVNDIPLRFGPRRLYRDRWIKWEQFPSDDNGK